MTRACTENQLTRRKSSAGDIFGDGMKSREQTTLERKNCRVWSVLHNTNAGWADVKNGRAVERASGRLGRDCSNMPASQADFPHPHPHPLLYEHLQ